MTLRHCNNTLQFILILHAKILFSLRKKGYEKIEMEIPFLLFLRKVYHSSDMNPIGFEVQGLGLVLKVGPGTLVGPGTHVGPEILIGLYQSG